MDLASLHLRYQSATPGVRAALISALGIVLGLSLLPVLIYVGGVTLLGRYEGASLGRMFGSVFHGLGKGNLASWIVVLGPALLYWLFRGLLRWWRSAA